MKINRNLFWRALAAITIVEACFLLAGCGDWESQAIQIISLINPAVVAVLNILAALGVSVSPSFMTAFNNWSQQASAALAEIKSLIAQYKTAAASAQPGILNQIQTALATVQQNLQTILPELHIDNAQHQLWVENALDAVIGFFSALQGLLPALPAATTRKAELELHAKANDVVKVFKAEFNDAVKNFGPEYELQ